MMNFSGDGGGCGITNSDVIDWMESVQNSALPDEPPKTVPSTNQKEPKPNVAPWNGDRETPGHKYSREAMNLIIAGHEERPGRKKTTPARSSYKRILLYGGTSPNRYVKFLSSLQFVNISIHFAGKTSFKFS